jgi:tyrosyl-tRNA synthetase
MEIIDEGSVILLEEQDLKRASFQKSKLKAIWIFMQSYDSWALCSHMIAIGGLLQSAFPLRV